MDGSAAFFYNTTTQRKSNKPKTPSIHPSTSAPINPNAESLRSLARTKHSSARHPTRQNNSKTSVSTDSQSSHSGKTNLTAQHIEETEYGSMLSTPLIDYKHSANQTRANTKAQREREAARKSSTTSGSSSDRKNVLQSAESRAAAAARGEVTGRSSSISSGTGSSGLTAVTSSDPPSHDELMARPFTRRNGRRYLRDSTIVYPLPCDLAEIHRQTLRTLLLCQVFNGPICSPAFNNKPPKRILEVGCGTGFWSIMCHRHFSQRGSSSISFTGIDIAPLAPRMDSDNDMNWKFVQHDLRRAPLPFRDEEFNFIMIKDMSMAIPTTGMQQTLIDEYIRILKPGGSLEIWDGDHSLRMLLPHAPPSTKESDDESEDEEQVHTNAMGTYTLTTQTPLASPQNTFLNDYNGWISKALESKNLSPMPCTAMLPMLHQESEQLTEIDSRRLAIPLGEVRWEREGVGGAVTQSTNGHAISSKGKAKEASGRTLTPGQAALRRTALMTIVQMIESLEPILREASGKGQDEWDRWQGNMMNDLLKQNGTSWGECLEVGAWWARKKKPPS